MPGKQRIGQFPLFSPFAAIVFVFQLVVLPNLSIEPLELSPRGYIGLTRNHLADLNGDGSLDLWQMGSFSDCNYVYELAHVRDEVGWITLKIHISPLKRGMGLEWFRWVFKTYLISSYLLGFDVVLQVFLIRKRLLRCFRLLCQT